MNYEVIFDLPLKENQIIELEKKSQDSNLWDDPDHARQVMQKLSRLQDEFVSWQNLEHHIQDSLELAGMEDESLRVDLEAEINTIEADIGKREFNALLSGDYDHGDAILAIHAGAGGTDSQDWAEMLERMYLRWAERNNFKMEFLDSSPGEEAGIKSVTIAVSGAYAFGYLRPEKGVHRLVRLSPFDSGHRRHTSFALVEVIPQVEDAGEIEINPKDIRIDTYRSSSAGGQNVQKNDTAIRITHIPSGLVVTCQNERSQTQNKENALRVLRARLLEIQREQQEKHLSDLRGEYTKAEWGSQIRSYVLHPYQMVKDHRTDFEVGNTQAVLDGDINGFINAFLRHQAGK
jgi:peptide chain release factor 2